jgi:site-specific DNA-methyltransferase (adenine-specific)
MPPNIFSQPNSGSRLALSIKLITGDCREALTALGPFDMIIADPPYGWEAAARMMVKPTGSMWVFGSMRFFMTWTPRSIAAGWRYAQDVVWEKHNGSGFHADRFKRVHEHAVQFYRDDSRWGDVFNDVQKTMDASPRTVRRKKRPPHMGDIEAGAYVSVEGGPRIMRSVIPMRSCHGIAIHRTEKPVGLLHILIRTSCPPGGTVGDMFAGSGAAGEACAQSGRNYVGAEIDPDMAAKATARFASNLFTA